MEVYENDVTGSTFVTIPCDDWLEGGGTSGGTSG